MLLSSEIHQLFTEDILQLLRKKNVFSVLDFLNLENKHIERCTSFTYLEIIEIKKHLAKTYSAPPINTLTYYRNTCSHSILISTGIPQLDDLLLGGLFTGTIYEVCAYADSQRLEFIMKILENVLCKDNIVYFLDTKRDFSAKNMKTMLSQSKDEIESINLLKNIFIKHICDKFNLVTALYDIKNDLKQGIKTRIIFIHSLSTVILSSGNHTEKNNILNHLANIMRYLAAEFNITIIVSNLITTWVDNPCFQDNQETIEKVACGKYWSSIPNVRVKIEKVSKENFEASLLKCNNGVSGKKCVIPSSLILGKLE